MEKGIIRRTHAFFQTIVSLRPSQLRRSSALIKGSQSKQESALTKTRGNATLRFPSTFSPAKTKSRCENTAAFILFTFLPLLPQAR